MTFFTSSEIDNVVKPSARLDDPRGELTGIDIFTSYFFSPASGNPRWDLTLTSPDVWDLSEGDYVPWVNLPWVKKVAHDSRDDAIIIGGFGSGKSSGLGAIGVYYSCLMAHFKFLCAAPVLYQARQMYEAIISDMLGWNEREDRPRFITDKIESVVSSPYPMIEFKNGSSMAFMSGKDDGDRIRSWSGDMIVLDEVGQFPSLDLLLENLGSRLRGLTHGRERLGKLYMMSNADSSPDLWQRVDAAKADPEHQFFISVTTRDNPYNTERQIKAIRRRIDDPDRADQMMNAKRPILSTGYFSSAQLSRAKSTELDSAMEYALDHELPGYHMEVSRGAGVVTWEMPYLEGHVYIVAGDIGQNNPPDRGSAPIVVFDVTDVPDGPATMAAFYWPYCSGQYTPFFERMKYAQDRYSPVMTIYDGTGMQRGFGELLWASEKRSWTDMDFTKFKTWGLAALKNLMELEMIKIPGNLHWLWVQLGSYNIPDKRLRQDIVMSLIMAAYHIQQVLVDSKSADGSDMEIENLPDNRGDRNRIGRSERGNMRLSRVR